jgi:capsular exopolysaccharide synthesis family protein
VGRSSGCGVATRSTPGDTVDLRDFLRVLRRRWRIVAALVVLATATAVAVTALSTKVYQADTQLFVSLQDSGSSTSTTAYQGNMFSQERVKSYAKIANSPKVTGPVVKQLRLDLTPDQLAGRITASAPTDTVLVDLVVRDPSPSQARDIANAVSTQFAKVVADLERPATGRASPVSVTVVRPADLPAAPVSPRPTINVALGLLVGLALGIGVAVLRETLDTTIKTSEDLQKLTGSSALGVIAYDGQAQKNPLVSQMDSRTGRGEAFRTLRTNLRFVDVDNPPRAVVLTSSVASEGKSTTACNLAITLASAGVRVILVEGDLRRPRVADYMGLDGSVGLTDVLIGRSALDVVLQPWGNSTLSVLASGPLPPNPSELLGSAQMGEVIEAMQARADIVLIDAPPLLPVTDAAVLGRECDGALLVVRHGKTTREQLSRSLDALQSVGARVLGTVLNMAPTGGAHGYYGYGYTSEYATRTDRPRLTTVDHPPAGERRQSSRVG